MISPAQSRYLIRHYQSEIEHIHHTARYVWENVRFWDLDTQFVINKLIRETITKYPYSSSYGIREVDTILSNSHFYFWDDIHRDLSSIHNIMCQLAPSDILNIQSIGAYREWSESIRLPNGIEYNCVHHTEIPSLIDQIQADIHRHPDLEHILIAYINILAYIHPFWDANGRTLSLWFDLILIHYGYPPVIMASLIASPDMQLSLFYTGIIQKNHTGMYGQFLELIKKRYSIYQL